MIDSSLSEWGGGVSISASWNQGVLLHKASLSSDSQILR